MLWHVIAFAAVAPAVAVANNPDHPRVGPGPNEVTMRTLEFREVPPGSQMDPFQAVRDFHATRLEWTYIDFDKRNRRAVAKIRDMGVLFGGAGSASMHGSIRAFPAQPHDIHMLDLDGNMIIQPHMRGWTEIRGIGDPSNPAFFEHHLAYYRRIIDWGADALHRDEPESPVFSAERYGGGFTPTGIAGFREWLKKNLSREDLTAIGIDDVRNFDYAEHLRARGAPVGDAFARYDCPVKPYWVRYWDDTTTDFWKRFIAEIKAYGGEQLTFSANNSSLQMWESYHREFDFAISELLLETANPIHIWQRSRAAKAHGKIQVFGPPKTRAQPVSEELKVGLLRRVIATAYACGMLGKVPWDVFDQSPDGKSRYFAKPSDVADLYAFVRGQDWSGFTEVGAFGEELNQNGSDPVIVSVKGGTGGVYGFVRAPVDGTSDEMHIHLIDWGVPMDEPAPRGTFRSPTGESFVMYSPAENIRRTLPEPFGIVLKKDAFAHSDKLAFELLIPVPYDAGAHAEAYRSGDYSNMVKRQSLEFGSDGETINLEIPALSPWGIVRVVSKPTREWDQTAH